MRKHKNRKQENILVEHMREHSDMARGFVKGDKATQDEKWNELKNKLNAAGPPVKEAAYWKKTWLDWKSNVKRKLSHNKKEVRKTGGGNFNQYILTQLEEEVSTVCGLYTTVDGIAQGKHFGAPNKSASSSSSGSDSTPPQSPRSGTSNSNVRKRRAANTGENNSNTRKTGGNLDELLEKENLHLESIGIQLQKLSEIKNCERSTLENIENKMDVIIDLKKKKLDETVRHNLQNEKNEKCRLEIKIKAVNLEQMKFDYMFSSCNQKK